MSTQPRHAAAHAYAVHCLGVHEAPDGTNRGPIQVADPQGGVDFFEQHDFVAGVGYPWCVTLFLTAWAVGAKHPLPYLTPSAHALGDWARKQGWAKTIRDLIPGDGCDWNEGSGHFSMFESFDPKTGLVHTIDGNWNNRVQRATHKIASLRTAVAIPETHRVRKPKPPLWTVATSASGHKVVLFSQRATETAFLKTILPPLVHRYGKAGLTIRKGKKK